jgi:DNA-binding NarL/FixJ family response regulator
VSDLPDECSAVVVDELALARAGAVAVLHARGVEVAGETHAAREAARLVTMEGVDLVVLGNAADLPTGDAARRLLALRPRPAVVALVAPVAEQLVAYLLALGVQGVVLRTGTTEELGAAVDAVRKGKQYVAPGLHGALRGALRPREPAGGEALLSSREREVLGLLAQGRSNREIAAALSVTLATVKSHLVHIYAKLDAGNRNEALGRALALGLLA